MFNRLAEAVAETLHKRDHVLVDGVLVSSKYERENGKSKKAEAAKVTFWSVRANSVRRLSHAEAETPAAPQNFEYLPPKTETIDEQAPPSRPNTGEHQAP